MKKIERLKEEFGNDKDADECTFKPKISTNTIRNRQSSVEDSRPGEIAGTKSVERYVKRMEKAREDKKEREQELKKVPGSG